MKGRWQGWAAAALLLMTAVDVSAQRAVRRVPAAAAFMPRVAGDGGPVRRVDARRCIDSDRISGAVVHSDRMVEVVMRGGRRYALRLASACPAVGYYSGFYFKRRERGELCAGTDRIMARSGGECRIAALSPMPRAGPGAVDKIGGAPIRSRASPRSRR